MTEVLAAVQIGKSSREGDGLVGRTEMAAPQDKEIAEITSL